MRLLATTARRALGLALAVAAALTAIVSPIPAAAQPGERCFPETGHCISGPIRQYWERNGGLAVFGYPISPQRRETVEQSWTGPVQWFERDRLEDHSADGQGVLAGRLGARALELQGINWQALPGDNAVAPGCRFFRETQLNLCGPFLRYWEQNGGLERFGYPLTRQREETIQGRAYAVQYFERRRMELHPENAGTPYEVLLGLLGRDVFAAEGDQNLAPIAPGDVDAADQQIILDAAYTFLRADWPGAKLAVGVVDVVGNFALAIGKPRLQNPIYVHLIRQGPDWQVMYVGPSIEPAGARAGGFPAELLAPSDRSRIVAAQVGTLQDPAGPGVDAYVTRPRVSGDFARFWVVPALSEGRDPASTFFKRSGGAWAFLTAGTAFPEDQLAEMGVPRELWPYGEIVSFDA